jgi:hypothetical protein
VLSDLCLRPVSQGNRSKVTEGTVLRSFSSVKQSWVFFSPFRNSDRLGQKIPVQPGLYLPLQKILLAENRFLQAGKIQAVLNLTSEVEEEVF